MNLFNLSTHSAVSSLNGDTRSTQDINNMHRSCPGGVVHLMEPQPQTSLTASENLFLDLLSISVFVDGVSEGV